MEQANLYLQRINQVVNHIRENLDGDLSLEALAQVACFSPFHFHRIFKTLTGQTISDVVLRLRLERAVMLLRADPSMNVTDAAFESGFVALAHFSRAFKKHFGQSPGRWDRFAPLQDRKNSQVFEKFPDYTVESLSDAAEQGTFTVQIKKLPAQRLAYIRVFNAYSDFSRIQAAYERLTAWYSRHGGDIETAAWYGMSQDDPDITPLEMCSFDWCVAAPQNWEADGEINLRDFPECQVAYVHLCGGLIEEDRVIQYLFRCWLPNSRYQPDNLPGMEIYHRPPSAMNWDAYDFDLAIPIIAL